MYSKPITQGIAANLTPGVRIEPLPQCKHWNTSPTHHPLATATDIVDLTIRLETNVQAQVCKPEYSLCFQWLPFTNESLRIWLTWKRIFQVSKRKVEDPSLPKWSLEYPLYFYISSYHFGKSRKWYDVTQITFALAKMVDDYFLDVQLPWRLLKKKCFGLCKALFQLTQTKFKGKSFYAQKCLITQNRIPFRHFHWTMDFGENVWRIFYGSIKSELNIIGLSESNKRCIIFKIIACCCG